MITYDTYKLTTVSVGKAMISEKGTILLKPRNRYIPITSKQFHFCFGILNYFEVQFIRLSVHDLKREE